MTAPRHIVVVGAGGNIGSHVVAHLARTPSVGRLTLVDRDVYEPKNLISQDIWPGDIGRPKARVQAARLRRIRPDLSVDAVPHAVEAVPLGRLRGDVMLACLDSLRARRTVNEAAWRLGVPWVDAGVQADGLLVRVNVYVPAAPDAPCLECAWDERHYAAQETAYPCLGGAGAAAPTNAPSCLGALAGSLQAIECRKLLDGRVAEALVGRQVVLDAAHHRHTVTAFRRNPRCRFDHEVWAIRKTGRRGGNLTIAQALRLGSQAGSGGEAVALRVEGDAIVRKATCAECGRARSVFRLARRLTSSQRTCGRCGGHLVAEGFDMVSEVDAAREPKRLLGRTLKGLGLRPGDVFTLASPAGDIHYEIEGHPV